MNLLATTAVTTEDLDLLFYIAVAGGIVFIVCIIIYFLLARYPELEKKLAKMTWGDSADLEVYNREGRWL